MCQNNKFHLKMKAGDAEACLRMTLSRSALHPRQIALAGTGVNMGVKGGNNARAVVGLLTCKSQNHRPVAACKWAMAQV